MNEKTFSVATMTTAATDKQISTIININANYIIKGIKYPETKFFSKAHAIMILEEMFKLKDSAEKRPYDKDTYYVLYERFAAKYPYNKMNVPVRDYRIDTEAIPDMSEPKVSKGLPKPTDVRHRVSEKAFNQAITRSFYTID